MCVYVHVRSGDRKSHNVSSLSVDLRGSWLQGGTVSLKSILLSGQMLSTGLLLLSVDPN